MPNRDFLIHAVSTLTCAIWRCYTLIRLEISRRTRWSCLKCEIVYLARDIPVFVMYCVNGASRSSLLIESTDSMIIQAIIIFCDAGERNLGYALLMTTNKPK